MKTIRSTHSGRIAEEVDLLKSIHHPNIVSFVDSVEQRGKVHIVMEYCEGGVLRDLIIEAAQEQ